MAHVPRQSVYFSANASVNQLNSIQACIGSVQDACGTIAATNHVLQHHTGDFDRLRTAMASQRHDVREAREHVAGEIAPLLRELIVRAENALTEDERHARALRNKATEELAQVEARSSHSVLGDTTKSPSVAALVNQAELDEHRRALEKLKAERKRLMERVSALEQRQGTSA